MEPILSTGDAVASPALMLPIQDSYSNVNQQGAPLDLSRHQPVPPRALLPKEIAPRSSQEELEAAISRLKLTSEPGQYATGTDSTNTEVASPGLQDRPCESSTTALEGQPGPHSSRMTVGGTSTGDTQQLTTQVPEDLVLLKPSEVSAEGSPTTPAQASQPAREVDGEKLSTDNGECAQPTDATTSEPSTSPRKRKPAGRRQATRRQATNPPAESAPPSKRGRVQSGETSAESEPKEPESAAAKPKRKKQSAEERPEADAEPVMPLRRSTRNRKQTQRFCF